jgi:PAS domain S-box-containing protein
MALVGAALVVLWALDLRSVQPAPRLVLIGQLGIALGAGCTIAALTARSFLLRGDVGVLLLGCGALVFAAGSLLSPMLASDSPNAMITVYNLAVWLSSLLHLVGVGSRDSLLGRRRTHWLVASYALCLGTMLLISAAARAGWTPDFFVQGSGGTPLRQLVLGSAAAMFGLSALQLLRPAGPQAGTPGFRRWYGYGLLLIALGLVAFQLQHAVGSPVNWLGVVAQWLGSLYLLAAAAASTRAVAAPAIALPPARPNAVLRYGAAALFVVAVTVVRLSFFSAMGDASPFGLFYAAVLLATFYGGWGPGLLALSLSVAAGNFFWVEPRHDWLIEESDVYAAMVFIVTCAMLIPLVMLLQRSRAQALAAQHARALAEAERTRAVELQRSESRYRALFDSVDQGVAVCELICDPQGRASDYRLIETNPAFGTLTGLGTDAVGKTARELAPALEPRWIEHCGAVALEGRTLRFEEHSSAQGRHFDIFATALEPRGRFVLLISDITTRKQAEQTLARALQRDTLALALGNALRPLSDPLEVQAAAARLLAEHLGFERVAYFEQRDDAYVISRSHARGVASLHGDYPLQALGSRTVDAVRAGRSVVCDDVVGDAALSDEERQALLRLQVGACATVPVMNGGRCVAGLIVHSAEPRRFSRDELTLIADSADHAWAAVERARSEAALRQSEAVFRTLGESLPDFLWVREPDGTPIYRNPAWYRYTGLDSVRSSDGDWRLTQHPEDQPRVTQLWRQALQEPRAFEVEYRCRRHDGVYRWYFARTVPVFDDAGRLVRWVGMSTDIHDRKLAAELLAQSLQREQARADEIETIMRLAPVAVWIARDAQCTRITGNEAGYRLLGAPPGSNVSVSAPPAERALPFRFLRDGRPLAPDEMTMQRCGRSGRPVASDPYDVELADGTRRTILSNAAPLLDAHGQVQGVVCISVDISERIAIERALKEADRRKDEFIAMLAHELRNPLAPVRNAVALIDRVHGDHPQLKWACEVIERQMRQMTRLIDDLMDLSRITQGVIKLDRRSVTLDSVVAIAVETSRPLIESQGHRLEIKLPAKALWLHADPTRLAQLFSNLLNNAAKYSEPCGRITLAAHAAGDEVVVEVSDTGFGIPPEMLDRVFDMFEQVDRTAERAGEGLGIGLTLVRRLAELHGGRVQAHSRGRGHGSTFEVRLPLERAVAPPPPPSAPPLAIADASSADASSAAAAAGTRHRILVVDDNEDARDTLAMMLEVLGHEVRSAADGLQALQVGREFLPEVVLLDLGMPKMNGYDAAVEMRRQAWGQHARLIATSGWGQPDDLQRSRAAGFDHHLVKPIDIAQLLGLLEPVAA